MEAHNWERWMQRWDQQQQGYLPYREERFQIMLDAIALQLPATCTVIDLACGPGAISQRLLRRFPQARCIAIDYDPVLLAIGQAVLGDMQGRLRWIEADLAEDAWVQQLENEAVDAVLTTTALHWLPDDRLVNLYHTLKQVIHPGGIFLNGDNYRFPSHQPTFKQMQDQVETRQNQQAFEQQGGENWEQWWNAIAQEPSLSELWAERQRRFDPRHTDRLPTLALHEAALLEAGFREVGTIWQRWDDRVLMAVC
jgi:trans-aconitate methyltransferase